MVLVAFILVPLVIYTIQREGVLKNLLKQSCWTISLDLTIYLVLPYIFSLTINTLHNLNELIYYSHIIYYIITLTINSHEYMTDYSNMFTHDVIITTYSFINSINFFNGLVMFNRYILCILKF